LIQRESSAMYRYPFNFENSCSGKLLHEYRENYETASDFLG